MRGREKLIGQLDLAIYYGFHLVVFSIPLVFVRISYDWFDLPKLTLLRIETIIILSLWILKGLLSNSLEIKRTKLDWPILIFLALALISTLSSIHLPTSLLGKYFRYEGLLTLINYAILFFLASQTFSDWRRVEAILRTMVITTTLIATYGILQYLRFDFINWGMAPWEEGRSFSTLGNPVFLGGYLALMLPIILGRYLSSREPFESILYGSAFLICSASAITTFSRGGWLASLIGLLVLALLVGRKVFFSRKVGLIFLGLGMVFLLILIIDIGGYRNPPYVGRLSIGDFVLKSKSLSLGERVSSIAKPGAGSFGTRLEIWKAVPRIVAKRPLFGWGPDTFRLVYPSFSSFRYAQLTKRALLADNAHNYFLQLAVSQGILGLLAFLAILAIFFWQGFRFHTRYQPTNQLTNQQTNKPTSQPANELCIGFLAGVIGYVVYLFSGINVVGSSAIFWLILGLLSRGGALSPPEGRHRGRLLHRSKDPYGSPLIIFVLLLTVSSLWLALRPLQADLYFARAEEMAEGADVLAIKQYQSAIRLNPYVELYHQKLAALYIQLTWQTGDKSFFDQAVRTYQRGQRINPWELDYYSFLGYLYRQGGQRFDSSYYSLAEKELKKVLEIDPYRSDAHGNLGLVYLQTERYQPALKEFKFLVKIDPQDAKTYLYLGMAYQGMKDKTGAIKAYQRALEIDPSLKEARRRLEEIGG